MPANQFTARCTRADRISTRPNTPENHAIEPNKLAALPGDRTLYAERRSLVDGLTTLLSGATTIAMEYSPNNDIPYISRVDGGTIDLLRSLGKIGRAHV